MANEDKKARDNVSSNKTGESALYRDRDCKGSGGSIGSKTLRNPLAAMPTTMGTYEMAPSWGRMQHLDWRMTC